MSDGPSAPTSESNHRARFIIDRTFPLRYYLRVALFLPLLPCFSLFVSRSGTNAIVPVRVVHVSRNEAINGATERVYVAPSQRFHALRAATTPMLGGSFTFMSRSTAHVSRRSDVSAHLEGSVLSLELPGGDGSSPSGTVRPSGEGFTL